MKWGRGESPLTMRGHFMFSEINSDSDRRNHANSNVICPISMFCPLRVLWQFFCGKILIITRYCHVWHNTVYSVVQHMATPRYNENSFRRKTAIKTRKGQSIEMGYIALESA